MAQGQIHPSQQKFRFFLHDFPKGFLRLHEHIQLVKALPLTKATDHHFIQLKFTFQLFPFLHQIRVLTGQSNEPIFDVGPGLQQTVADLLDLGKPFAEVLPFPRRAGGVLIFDAFQCAFARLYPLLKHLRSSSTPRGATGHYVHRG